MPAIQSGAERWGMLFRSESMCGRLAQKDCRIAVTLGALKAGICMRPRRLPSMACHVRRNTVLNLIEWRVWLHKESAEIARRWHPVRCHAR